jgi:hypothetical protein
MIGKILLASLAVAVAVPDLTAARSAHRHRPKAQAEARIACTVLGCIPVPPECGQTYGRTSTGRPTGYDVIICPPGIWPLK